MTTPELERFFELADSYQSARDERIDMRTPSVLYVNRQVAATLLADYAVDYLTVLRGKIADAEGREDE